MRLRRSLIVWLTLCLTLATWQLPAAESPYFAPADAVIAVTDLEDIYGPIGPLRRWIRTHPARAAEQGDGFILTDRPSFTNANTTVPAGWVQLESGYQYTTSSLSDASGSTQNWPELNLRVGLSEHVELRILWNGVSELNANAGHLDEKSEWSSNMQAGFKFLVSKEDGWIPLSALIVTVFLPTGDGSDHRPFGKNANFSKGVSPLVDYIYGYSFGEGWTLLGSTGAVFNGGGSKLLTEYFQSAVLQWDISNRYSIYYESYVMFDAYRDRTTGAPYMDGGVLWRPRNNLQFDWRAGFGLNDNADDFFTGAGLSLRY